MTKELLSDMLDEDSEIITLLYGADVSEDEAEARPVFRRSLSGFRCRNPLWRPAAVLLYYICGIIFINDIFAKQYGKELKINLQFFRFNILKNGDEIMDILAESIQSLKE